MLLNTYHNIQNSAIKEAVSIGNIKSYFVKVTDVDDSPDMTDIHPRDREDMDLRFMTLNKIMFPKTLALIQQDAN